MPLLATKALLTALGAHVLFPVLSPWAVSKGNRSCRLLQSGVSVLPSDGRVPSPLSSMFKERAKKDFSAGKPLWRRARVSPGAEKCFDSLTFKARNRTCSRKIRLIFN
ncbi:MAG: hypothetical protein A2Y95_10325 [Deltaproteobacteria bacterium RBG_13_65_10]|nr:MAG: hypothetical protein A2Y95_10325 [Deltaproteobacteria bacterium RBG_13_65_10]